MPISKSKIIRDLLVACCYMHAKDAEALVARALLDRSKKRKRGGDQHPKESGHDSQISRADICHRLENSQQFTLTAISDLFQDNQRMPDEFRDKHIDKSNELFKSRIIQEIDNHNELQLQARFARFTRDDDDLDIDTRMGAGMEAVCILRALKQRLGFHIWTLQAALHAKYPILERNYPVYGMPQHPHLQDDKGNYTFSSKVELQLLNLHHRTQHGISTQVTKNQEGVAVVAPADALVFANGYQLHNNQAADHNDATGVRRYIAEGGFDSLVGSEKKRTQHRSQELHAHGTEALRLSMNEGKPIRVFDKMEHSINGGTQYKYAGLFKVVAEHHDINEGKDVIFFTLVNEEEQQ